MTLSKHREKGKEVLPSSETSEYSSCSMFDLDWDGYDEWDFHIWNRTAILKKDVPIKDCNQWIFDTSEYKSSIQSDMSLVCSQSAEEKKRIILTIYACGYMVGAILFGCIADRLGRHKTLVLSLFLQVVFGVSAGVVKNYNVFLTLRFLTGCVVAGAFNTAFVMIMEIIGPSRRMAAGVFVQGWLSVGIMILPGIAYVIREQKKLQVILALPVSMLLIYYWIIPESPRWFASKGRFEDSEKVLRRMAAVNGRELPDQLRLQENRKHNDEERLKRQPLFIDLFLTRNMRIKSCIVLFIWFAQFFVYYTLNAHIGPISGNIYLTGFLSGASEIPGYFICVLVINRVGRRWPLLVMLTLSCFIAIICIVFLGLSGSSSSGLTFKALFGKLLVAASIASTYVYSAELFPTSVRSSGLGLASAASSLGGVLAVELSHSMEAVYPPLTLILSAMFAVSASMLSFFLPETLNHNLPETLVDGEQFGKKCVTTFLETKNIHGSFKIKREKKEVLDLGSACTLNWGSNKLDTVQIPQSI